MFKPNADHIEELMRAKEICDSLIDEILDENLCAEIIWLSTARINIENVLSKLSAEIEALTP